MTSPARTLAIDIETFSSVDLKKSGVYKYTESPDFEIQLFSYSYNEGPVHTLDLTAGEQLPDGVIADLVNEDCQKTAFNANFEITCIGQYFGIVLLPEQWECTMVKATMLGLPSSLDAVSKALNLSEAKNAEGKALIRYFAIPCKPTKGNGMRTRNEPWHDLEKWERYCKYNNQDVVVELAVRRVIAFFIITEKERLVWAIDQRINSRGVLLDPVFIQNALTFYGTYNDRLAEEAIKLTGLDNPNSRNQLKDWLEQAIDSEIIGLKKTDIPAILEKTDSNDVKRVLQIRQEMAKTSVKKYVAMANAICKDNRVRGLLQYYGAGRTGRWAGRLVQVQNLPRNELKDLDLARRMVFDGDEELFEICFGNVPDTLSQLIRTAFVAPAGRKLAVADFSAIEAVVIAWLSGERWRLEVFNTHGKIYEASAAQMFKVPIESVTKGSDLRQKGKVSELALGYQGAVNALITMGALKMGLTKEELPKLVSMWRNANKAIVKLWQVVENAALDAVDSGAPQRLMYGLTFYTKVCSHFTVLFIRLPSGRELSYLNPKIVTNRFGNPALTYEGMDQTTKKWKRQDTYGGKLVENIVQAIARDCLAEALLKMDSSGYDMVMHVHDEIVSEIPESLTLDEVNAIMSAPISWAPGLPLRADSYETKYYKKD